MALTSERVAVSYTDCGIQQMSQPMALANELHFGKVTKKRKAVIFSCLPQLTATAGYLLLFSKHLSWAHNSLFYFHSDE